MTLCASHSVRLCSSVLGGGGVTLSAQCSSCPSGSTLDTINVDVCVGTDTLNLNVVYCHREYSPPSTSPPCTTPNAANSYTVIQRICAAGDPLPADISAVWNAVYCAFNPYGGDVLNQLPNVGDIALGQQWCWVISYPRCVKVQSGCIVECDSHICCTRQYRFWKDSSTGEYLWNLPNGDCSSTASCSLGCTDNGCSFTDPDDCEDCRP